MRNFFGKARKHKKKPVWLGDAQWEGFQQYWANEHYKKLSEMAQKSRLGTLEIGGPSLYTCVFIYMHKHRRRLVNKVAMYFFNFNTVVWLVVDIILSGTYIERTTWDEASASTHKLCGKEDAPWVDKKSQQAYVSN